MRTINLLLPHPTRLMKRTIAIMIDSPATNEAADYVEKFRDHLCQAADEFCEDNVPDFEITVNIWPAQIA